MTAELERLALGVPAAELPRATSRPPGSCAGSTSGLGGICLFSYNVARPERLAALTGAAARGAGPAC